MYKNLELYREYDECARKFSIATLIAILNWLKTFWKDYVEKNHSIVELIQAKLIHIF